MTKRSQRFKTLRMRKSVNWCCHPRFFWVTSELVLAPPSLPPHNRFLSPQFAILTWTNRLVSDLRINGCFDRSILFIKIVLGFHFYVWHKQVYFKKKSIVSVSWFAVLFPRPSLCKMWARKSFHFYRWNSSIFHYPSFPDKLNHLSHRPIPVLIHLTKNLSRWSLLVKMEPA